MEKQLLKLCVSLALIILSDSCKEEKLPQDLPRSFSASVSDIDTTGAVFHGTIGADEGFLEQVADHGFEWFGPDSQGAYRIYTTTLGVPSTLAFSKKIDYSLVAHESYQVRAFIVRKDNKKIYSRDVIFTSVGSHKPLPTVQSFSPNKGAPKDIVTLTGTGFGSLVSENTITFIPQDNFSNPVNAQVKTASPTSLTFEVPLFHGALKAIRLTVKESGSLDLTGLFSFVQPQIFDLLPTKFCDSIRFTGADLLTLGQPTSVSINDTPVAGKITNTLASFPTSFVWDFTVKIVIKYDVGGQAYIVEKSYGNPFIFPEVTSVSRLDELKPGDIITVRGNNLPFCDGVGVQVSDGGPSISLLPGSSSSTQTQLAVNSFSCGQFAFSLTYIGKEFFTSAPASPPSFEVTDAPQHITYGEPFSIIGEGLSDTDYAITVSFNGRTLSWEKLAPSTSGTTSGDLTVDGPITLFPGDYTSFLSIFKCGTLKDIPVTFTIPPMEITSVTPLTFTGPSTDFTIVGNNFPEEIEVTLTNDQVGELETQILSYSPNAVTFRLSWTTAINASFKVQITSFDSFSVTSAQEILVHVD